MHPRASAPARSAHAPPAGCLHLRREQRFPRGAHELFAFFSDPANLEAITPPWLRFRMLRASNEPLREGTRIEYRLRVRGLPIRWISEITEWRPPHRFADLQLAGPYRYWHHLHEFRPVEGGTLMLDEVAYAVLGGRFVDKLLVRPDLERIFDYRRERLAERLQ